MSSAAKTINVMCGKCDGRGRINAFSHYDNGKCFECGGAGTVSCRSVSEKSAARCRAACDIGALIETGDNILSSNPKWAHWMVARAAKEMLIVGDKEWARRQLNTLPANLRAAVNAAGREFSK